MLPRLKRRKESVNYKEDDERQPESTSKWTNEDIEKFNIVVRDVEGFPTFNNIVVQLELREWDGENWLNNCNVESLNVNNKIKTLVDKIIEVQTYSGMLDEYYVDGYMNTLLSLFQFDDYPCLFYPQHIFTATLTSEKSEETIVSKSDFGILNKKNRSIVVVVEDKTLANASVGNKWKENQVLGEIFVALHSDNKCKTVYAIRVVVNLFTFYKSTVTPEYKMACLTRNLKGEELIIERYPRVDL
jgi:hypothetical protein